MAEGQSMREYYKLCVFAFIFGFGGSVWGGLTYYIGQPIAYLSFLKASPFQIAIIAAIFWAGSLLPQVYAAYKSESLPIKKYFIVWSFTLSSLGFLAAGVYILLTGAANPAVSIVVFLICYTWACAMIGLYIPSFFAILFKVTPTERLGTLVGRLFAIQFGGIFFSGFAAKAIANAFDEPTRYAVLFILTFVITIIAALVIASLKEPEGEPVESAPSFSAYIGKLITIYRTDTLFSKFIFAKWLMCGHYIMLAFLYIFLVNERGFNQDNASWFPTFFGLGLMIGGFTISKIADVYGPKYMLVTSQILAIVYTLVAWLIPSINPVFVIGAFIIIGFAQQSDNIGYTNMTLFCCPTADKSTYVAAVNVGFFLPMVFLPIIIGKLMDAGILSYNGVFTISLIMMVAAIVYILAVVENPKTFVDMKAASRASE